MAISSASLKVSRFIHQEDLRNYHVFRGGDHDLILIPVNSSHALLLAGKDIAKSNRILQTIQEMLSVRQFIGKVLQLLGVGPAPITTELSILESQPLTLEPEEPEPEVDLDALFATANKNATVKDVDAFWDEAVEKTSNIPTNPDVISFDEASKLGLTPGKTMPIKLTGPLKDTGSLKKK
jgi:hypothetical protein